MNLTIQNLTKEIQQIWNPPQWPPGGSPWTQSRQQPSGGHRLRPRTFYVPGTSSAPPHFSFPEEPMRNGWHFLVVGNIIQDVNPEPLLMFKTHFSRCFLTSPGAFKSF
jgi:hypothetical protein